MSFEIKGPDRTPSIQPSAQTGDGGAGNLGYFRQEKKKKQDEKDEGDTLELSNKKEKDDEELKSGNKPDSIGTKIKTFWFNIHGIFNEVIDERLSDK